MKASCAARSSELFLERTPPLSASEQGTLGVYGEVPCVTAPCRFAVEYDAEVGDAPKCSPAESRSPITQKSQELVVRHRESGRKIAYSVIRRWRVRISADELQSAVDMALCSAARRFDSTYEASFLTYAYYSIKGELSQLITDRVHSRNQRSIDGVSDISFSSSEMLSRDRTPEDRLLAKETSSSLYDAFEKLPDLEKRIIKEVYLEEQAMVDASSKVECSKRHMFRLRNRALERLRKRLGAAAM